MIKEAVWENCFQPFGNWIIRACWLLSTVNCCLMEWFLTEIWSRNILSVWRVTRLFHYSDVIMGAIASQITSLTIVYSTVYSDADQRKHQNCASLVTGEFPAQMANNAEKMFPFDDVFICQWQCSCISVADYHFIGLGDHSNIYKMQSWPEGWIGQRRSLMRI